MKLINSKVLLQCKIENESGNFENFEIVLIENEDTVKTELRKVDILKEESFEKSKVSNSALEIKKLVEKIVKYFHDKKLIKKNDFCNLSDEVSEIIKDEF